MFDWNSMREVWSGNNRGCLASIIPSSLLMSTRNINYTNKTFKLRFNALKFNFSLQKELFYAQESVLTVENVNKSRFMVVICITIRSNE